MSSSVPDVSQKLQDVKCCEVNSSVSDVNHKDDALCAEMSTNAMEASNHAEDMLPVSPPVKDCEKMVETDVVVEESLDHAYSWVIVFASFINCWIVGTMFIGFSILYVEITEYFGSSKFVAGWIGSFYMASGNIFGEKCFYYLLFCHHCSYFT